MRAIPATVIKILQWQWIIVGILAGLVALSFGHLMGRSVLFGGLATIIPNHISALYFFTRDARYPKRLLWSAFVSEFVKLALTIVFCVLLLKNQLVSLIPMLLGLLSAYVAYVLPIMPVKKGKMT